MNEKAKDQSGMGIAGMVIGIISLFLSCLFVGGFLGVVGLILSIFGIASKDKGHGTSIAGIALNSVAIVVMMIMMFVAAVGSSDDKFTELEDKYYVGDTWENKTLRVAYTSRYEFTDYNQYNAPAKGNKIICAEFEFENIGSSDTSVTYADFHGYADGYEVEQSHAPDEAGFEFSIKMSAGRKGTGKVAFEVPEDSKEIEIEFSPNFWTSENVIFAYE